MIDTYAGERKIKERGQIYLSATSGMIADGMGLNAPGLVAYVNYKMRARFPDAVNVAVAALVGIMHSKPPTIELPAAMEPMRTVATNLGESLEVLLRRINEAQLITGRIGLLLDIFDGAPVGTTPYIATYEAKDILNWDDGSFNTALTLKNLNLVSLDESGDRRVAELEWEHKNKFRVLILGDVQANEGAEEGAKYQVGIFDDSGAAFSKASLIEPSLGGRTLDFIPFTFINATDIVANPDKPPLLGLADLVLGIYRGEADYRQALFMQGQDTLVVIGVADADKDFRTGAGAAIILPTEGDAKFIGVDSTGLSEMRQALENDKREASQRSGDLVDSTSRERESGDALRIRVVARTATLNQLALTGAFGLESSLKQAAIWLGANPDEVIVTPNLDFVNDTLGGEELVKLVSAKTLGAPLSNQSIHKLMKEKALTDMTLAEELAAIDEEEPIPGSSSDGLPDEENNPDENTGHLDGDEDK